MMPQVTVYYESTCPICNRRIDFYRRFDKKQAVIWQDIAENREGLEEEMTNSRIGAVFHVRDASGNLKKGINAYNTLWKELQNFWLLAFFTSLYSLKWIFIIIYAMSWRARWHLGKHRQFHERNLT